MSDEQQRREHDQDAASEAKPVNAGDDDLLASEVERMQETIDSLRAEVKRLQAAAQPTAPKPGGAAFIDGALSRCDALLRDNPGIDTCCGLEADAVNLAAEVRRLREQLRRVEALIDMQHYESLIEVGDIRAALNGSRRD